MRLNLRLKKALAGTAAVVMMGAAMPVATYAADYDNHWAQSTIAKWAEKEVIKGYEDGTFKPNNHVTRAEFASIMVRVFGLTDTVDAKAFNDVKTNKWYASDVAKITAAGMMNGYEDNTFKPEQTVTREEAAAIMTRAYALVAKEGTLNFKDASSIANWAKADVTTLVTNGYISGDQANNFRPKAPLTRAEALTMINNVTTAFINAPGVYTQEVKGNLVVNTVGVTLKDMTVEGNLYLAEGVSAGTVTLDNVTVLGDIIIRKGSYERPIKLTGATVQVDGKDVLVPIKNNEVKIVVDANKAITVNGVTFKKGQAISAVTLHEKAKLKEMNVALVGKVGTDLETEKAYNLSDLANIVADKDNQEMILNVLKSFKDEFSTAQYNKAVEIVEELMGQVEDFAEDNKVVTVDTILRQMNRVQDKLQDPDVKVVLTKLEKALKTLGIQVKNLGKTPIKAETELTLTSLKQGYGLQKVKVQVEFK